MKSINDKRYAGLVALALTLTATACSAGQKEQGTQDLKAPTPASVQPVSQELEQGSAPAPKQKGKAMNRDQQTMMARKDLAKRLDVPLEEVELAGALDVTWRSSAMGCPKPGEQYMQALVAGRSIMLRVGEQSYRYHAKRAGEPFHCPDNMAELPHSRPSDI